MQLPDFKDFLSTLTEKDFEDMVKTDTVQLAQVSNKMSPEEVQLIITKAMTQTAIASIQATLYLIEKYHNWLNQQLS